MLFFSSVETRSKYIRIINMTLDWNLTDLEFLLQLLDKCCFFFFLPPCGVNLNIKNVEQVKNVHLL